MKRVLNFFSWLFKVCCSFVSNKPKPIKATDSITSGYQIHYSEDVPQNIKDDTIYIIQDGLKPESLAFKCPCGCNSNIILNLLEDASPRWRYEILSNDSLNIYPSIWRKSGCKSHFFIVESIVKWV
jgi:hypothetical protein